MKEVVLVRRGVVLLPIVSERITRPHRAIVGDAAPLVRYLCRAVPRFAHFWD